MVRCSLSALIAIVVKQIMLKLIAGNMGFDVMHAMRPQYELRTDIGDIAVDLVDGFNKHSGLGAGCVKYTAISQ